MLKRGSFSTKLLITVVLTVYTLGMSSILLPLIEYAIDYQRIATEECENLDRPELACNGKCYVSKQITKQEKPETSTMDTKIVIQKSSIDPHCVNSMSSKLSHFISITCDSNELPLDNIVLPVLGPPPQC